MAFLEAVLAFIEHEGKICLRRQKLDARFGGNTLVLPGGIIDPGETSEEALRREVDEEVAIGLSVFRYVGLFESYRNAIPWWRIHLFYATTFTCLDHEPETTVDWYLKNALPFELMRATDELWMPRIVAGEKLKVVLYYGANEHVLITSVIEKIE